MYTNSRELHYRIDYLIQQKQSILESLKKVEEENKQLREIIKGCESELDGSGIDIWYGYHHLKHK